jgi:hypothetical protein
MCPNDTTNEIPYGFCQCGCGQKTKLARQDNPEHGHIKGKPLRYILNHHNTPPTIQDKFWQHVSKQDDESCWEWQGNQTDFGYGKFTYRGKTYLAHRVSWEIHYGAIPKGKFVCHNCPDGDNPRCANPHHLWLGTSTENTADRQAKGRQAKGTKYPHAKISDPDVHQIRKWHQQGITNRQIAKLIGCSNSTVDRIVSGRAWNHVT